MPEPIKVDNSNPVTAYQTARTLGVSKKRTDEIVRDVRRILSRDAKTGEFVIRARKTAKDVDGSRHGATKFRHSSPKTHSRKTGAGHRRG